MDKLLALDNLRSKLRSGKPSIGSWIQIPDSTSAEIMGAAGYEWIAVDLEHASIDPGSLVNIFRSLELHNTLPFARLSSVDPDLCKTALDAGACGLIFPKIESAKELRIAYDSSLWPPKGSRGVAFNRANMFGKYFEDYKKLATRPFIVAMIESTKGVLNIDEILGLNMADAVLIGPYDLSGSLGCVGELSSDLVKDSILKLKCACSKAKVPLGVHQVTPSLSALEELVVDGFQFIPYCLDTVFLSTSSISPA